MPESREISSICRHLRTAEQLLLNPNPQAIEQAGFVLNQALSLAEGSADARVAEEQVANLRAGCIRVKTLLEGALRAQWAYIHRLSATTSTYTAGPGTKSWSARSSTLNLKG